MTKAKKRQFLPKINFASPRTRMLSVVLVFALVGGVYMVFRSFAATATTLYYVDNNSMISSDSGSSAPCRATKVVDPAKGTYNILNLACSTNGTGAYAKTNGASITSDIINKYYRLCANVKGAGSFTVSVSLPSTSGAQVQAADFVASGSGYTKYCTKQIFVNQAGPFSGYALAKNGGTFINVGSLVLEQDIALSWINPVKPNTADPGVLKYNGKYYMVGTDDSQAKFNIYSSSDLVNWTFTGSSVFNGTHPWGKNYFWAPELHYFGGKFFVYYSASDATGLRLGVATATNILGPYTDLGRPLKTDTVNIIDANEFTDDNGRNYLYWKTDDSNSRIYGQELNASGTGFIGSPVQVLTKGLAWEGTQGIEGPWVMKKNGVYYMFYSGNLFATDKYAVGVAKSSGPLSTFTKKGDPILKSGNRFKGPGHNSVVSTGTNDYMVYHAWDVLPNSGNRTGLIDKIVWSNGWPTVNDTTPSEFSQAFPN